MYTYNSLPTDGTSGPFPIGFNYLDGSTLSVTLYDTDGITNPVPLTFTLSGTVSDDQPQGSTFNLATAQVAGRVLKVEKTIDLDTPALVWNQGAEITQKNLRKTTKNLMEMAQSAWDKALTALTRNQDVLDSIVAVIPENVLLAADSIAADRVLAQAAAATAIAQRVNVSQELELDFGSALYQTHKKFVITSLNIPAGTPVRVTQTSKPSANHTQDECAAERITCTAYVPSTNTLEIDATSTQGSIHGIFNFVLTY